MANILLNPDDLQNEAGTSPPPECVDGLIVVSEAVGYEFEIAWAGVGDVASGDILAGNGWITHDGLLSRYLNVVVDGAVVQSIEVPPGGAQGIYFGANCGGATTAGIVLADTPTGTVAAIVGLLSLSLTPSAGVNNNCTCSDAGGRVYRTLLQLRQLVMRRCGFGNQIDNPPPGVAEMIDSFLYEAQYSLYNRFSSLRLERFFTWQLLAGVNLYGVGDNIDGCSKRINPDKIEYVGAIREGGLWTRLIAGIPPSYNSYPSTTGYPIRYEIRQCIEVWPMPDNTAGQLVIKGGAYLGPFEADDDVASIDDSLIFALALADAKAHYRQPDADRYVQRAEVLLNALVAGTHLTRKYVPGESYDDYSVYVQPLPSVPFPPNS